MIIFSSKTFEKEIVHGIIRIGDKMKKLVSIFFSLINLIAIFLLIFIFSVHFLVREETVNKVSSRIYYLDLVNIEAGASEMKENFDSIYLSLKNAGVSNSHIQEFYEGNFFKKAVGKVIYTESNYLLFGGELKTYTLDELNSLSNKTISQMKDLMEEEKRVLSSTMVENNLKILSIENSIRSTINNASYSKIQLIRYIFSNPFKVILLCLILISIVCQYFLNKEKMFSYIFVPTILCCMMGLLISLFLPIFFIQFFSNPFLEMILYFYIKVFSNYLLYFSLILLSISIFYLMIHESMIERMKKHIRPRLKKIRSRKRYFGNQGVGDEME